MQTPVMTHDTVPASLLHRQPTELALRQPYLLQTAFDRQGADDEDATALTLSDLLGMILKHKWTLLLVILVGGCQPYERKPLDLDATRTTWLGRSPADPSVRKQATPGDKSSLRAPPKKSQNLQRHAPRHF